MLNDVLQFVGNAILSLVYSFIDQTIELTDSFINLFANIVDGSVNDFVSFVFYLVNTIIENVSNFLISGASDFLFKFTNIIGNLLKDLSAKGSKVDYIELRCQWITYILERLPEIGVGHV